MLEFLASTDFWSIIFKVLLTALITGLIGIVTTQLGRLIAKCKNSKLRREAKIAVEAAEMRYPNEGRKMGPEKMAYVMDYLAIRFPKIRSNQYLYNIAESAVYALNNKKQEQEAEESFKEKYGELPNDLYTGNDDVKKIDADLESAQKDSEIQVEEEIKKTESVNFDLKSF